MLNALFSSPKVAVSLEEDQLFVHPVDSDYPVRESFARTTQVGHNFNLFRSLTDHLSRTTDS